MYHNVTHDPDTIGDVTRRRFDIEALDEVDPFEVDDQLIHLYKHGGMDSATSTRSGWISRCSTQAKKMGQQTG